MDIMSFATKPAEAVEAFHGILYGDSGTGKTSTLDDPDFKVAHFDLEGGSSVLQGAPNIVRWDIPEIAKKTGKHEYEVLNELGAAIRSGMFKDFDMVGIDSLTRYQEVVKDYVATKFAPNRKREIIGKFGAQSDWGDLMDLMTRTFRAFHTLTKRGKDSIHIMWIAHVGKEFDEVTNAVVRTKVALQGSQTPDIVMSVVDGFFYMYNRPVLDAEKKATGEIERGITTRTMGVFSAKARQSKRMEALPVRIVSPVWSEIFAKLGYVRKDV